MANRLRLLVEDTDSLHVLSNLLNEHGVAARRIEKQRLQNVADAIAAEEAGGVDVLLADLTVQLQAADQERVGVVVDADLDLAARWQAVRARIEAAGEVVLPAEPDPDGTVVHVEQLERTLVVGVWLMPDNRIGGMIEDFLEHLVPAGDPLLPHARACIEGIPQGERRFVHEGADHTTKALMHTWLAWQDEPGRPLGQAITQRYLDANAGHALAFVAWARRLFDLPTAEVPVGG